MFIAERRAIEPLGGALQRRHCAHVRQLPDILGAGAAHQLLQQGRHTLDHLALQPADQPRGAEAGQLGAGTAGNTDDRQQGQGAGAAPQPFHPVQRRPQTLVQATAQEDHGPQRHGAAQSEAEQQEAGGSARPIEHGAGEDQPEDGTGAGRPQQTCGEPHQPGRQCRGQPAGITLQPVAQPQPGPRYPGTETSGEQSQRRYGQQAKGQVAAPLAGLDDPLTGNHRQAGQHGKARGQAGERHEWRPGRTTGTRKQQRQYGKDAGAEQGQHPT
ncbi:hypothetical protein FQZ97_845000 [compost metagenome]